MSRGSRKLGPLHPEVEETERLAPTSLSREQQWELYRFMVLNRLVEDRLASLYRGGKLVGGAYSSRGQEATSVGSAYALQPQDWIGPLIRNLGANLVRGLAPRRLFALHMGRVLGRGDAPGGGVSDGDLAKDNLPGTDLARGVVGPIAMLGALSTVMAGVALAGRLQRKDLVALTWIGDGGTSTGEFHEAFNFAAALNLPLVVVAENNGYAYSTPTARQMRIRDIAVRAAGYGVPGEIVDGNDVLAVYEATRRAVERARRGGGPTLIESKTFRMKGHAEHDDAAYVPRELLAAWEKRDPIARFERHLEAGSLATRGDFEALAAEIGSGLDADVAAAMAAPLPAAEEALKGVYHP
jgi:TPP-dependent pyruvate/acetoin dehydrogenase alpha subunit